MAHTVCSDDQAERWEEELYGTHCVSRFRATGGGTLDRSKGRTLDASRIFAAAHILP